MAQYRQPLLKAYGIEKDENNTDQLVTNLPKSYPNCRESNKKDAKFCIKCRMILTYDSYSEVRNEDKQKIDKIESDME